MFHKVANMPQEKKVMIKLSKQEAKINLLLLQFIVLLVVGSRRITTEVIVVPEMKPRLFPFHSHHNYLLKTLAMILLSFAV